MENPCEKCREYDFCQTELPCKRHDAYMDLSKSNIGNQRGYSEKEDTILNK